MQNTPTAKTMRSNVHQIQEHHTQNPLKDKHFICVFCKYFRGVKQPSVCSFHGYKVKLDTVACEFGEAWNE